MDKPKIKWSSTILVDTVLVNLAFLFAYLTSRQFGFDLLKQPTPFSTLLQNVDISPYQYFLGIAAVVTTIRIGMLLGFNLYKPMWQYASVKEFRTLATAITLATVGLIGLSILMKITWVLFLIDGLYNFALIGFTKFSARILQEDSSVTDKSSQSRAAAKNKAGMVAQFPARKPSTKVLIVGAGETGIGVLRALRNHPQKGYVPVGFIDDAPHKVGRSVAGLEVLGTTSRPHLYRTQARDRRSRHRYPIRTGWKNSRYYSTMRISRVSVQNCP